LLNHEWSEAVSGQAQIMSAEALAAVRARSATTAAPAALRYFVLYGLAARV